MRRLDWQGISKMVEGEGEEHRLRKLRRGLFIGGVLLILGAGFFALVLEEHSQAFAVFVLVLTVAWFVFAFFIVKYFALMIKNLFR